MCQETKYLLTDRISYCEIVPFFLSYDTPFTPFLFLSFPRMGAFSFSGSLGVDGFEEGGLNSTISEDTLLGNHYVNITPRLDWT